MKLSARSLLISVGSVKRSCGTAMQKWALTQPGWWQECWPLRAQLDGAELPTYCSWLKKPWGERGVPWQIHQQHPEPRLSISSEEHPATRAPFAKRFMVLCAMSLSLPWCVQSNEVPVFCIQQKSCILWAIKQSLLAKDQVTGNTKLSITEQEGSLSSYSQFEEL